MTPTLSVTILEGLGAELEESWGEGVYLLISALKTGIVVIHQLPKTSETFWFRLLGKGRVQEQAIPEVAALPANHPYRNSALDLLGNLKVVLEARETIEPEDRELIMQLSPLYLEKIQAAQLVGCQEGHQEGRREEGQALILRQLKRRVGILSPEVEARVRALPLERLEELGEALLDFQSMADLEAWIAGSV